MYRTKCHVTDAVKAEDARMATLISNESEEVLA